MATYSSMEEIEKRTNAIEHLGSIKTFGAILITRAIKMEDQLSQEKFRGYVVNPEIVRSWLGPTLNLETLVTHIPNRNDPAEDIRFIYNANQLRVRTIPQQEPDWGKGVSELWWKDKESRNEFSIFTDLWSYAVKKY